MFPWNCKWGDEEEMSNFLIEWILRAEKSAREQAGKWPKWQEMASTKAGIAEDVLRSRGKKSKRASLIPSHLVDSNVVSCLEFITSSSQRKAFTYPLLFLGGKRKHKIYLLCYNSVSHCHCFLSNGTKHSKRQISWCSPTNYPHKKSYLITLTKNLFFGWNPSLVFNQKTFI